MVHRIQRGILVPAALLLLVNPARPAQRDIIETDWAGFERQVETRKLLGRMAEIRFTDGGRTRAKVAGVRNDTLAVGLNRDLDRWKTEKHLAGIPAGHIASVRFTGKTGRGRLIGSLAGLGGGAAIGAAVATSSEVTEGPFAILIPASAAGMALIGWLVGYLIGRAADKSAPEFVLTHQSQN